MSGTVLVTQPAASLPTATPDSSTKLIAQTAQGTRQVDAADALAGKTISGVKAAAPTDPAHVARKQDVADAVADKATTQALSQGLAGKADADATNQALAGKADAAALAQVGQTAAAALPRENGTATGLKLDSDPTDDMDAVRKGYADTVAANEALKARLVVPSLAAADLTTVPLVATAFTTLGYNTPGDFGEGTYAYVATEPTHAGKKKIGSRWFELQSIMVTPRQFGALGKGANETVALSNMWAYYVLRLAVGNFFGIQYPTQGVPAVFIPPGRFRGYDVVWATDLTDASIYGTGNASCLDGLQIEVGGFRSTGMNFKIVDSRNVNNTPPARSIGVLFKTETRRGSRWINVHVYGKHIGFHKKGGAQDALIECTAEKCNYSLIATETGDSRIIGGNLGGALKSSYRNRGAGEMKIIGTHFSSAGDQAILIEGTDRRSVVEDYFSNVTATNSINRRTAPILRVIDNGSGGARLVYHENPAIASAVQVDNSAGTRFLGGDDVFASEAKMIVTSATGGISSLKVNGITELLSGAIAWTSASGGAASIVAAVNAGTATHGFSASQDDDKLWVISPDPMVGSNVHINGQTLSWTLTSGTASSYPFIQITTASAHGLAVGDGAEINGTLPLNADGYGLLDGIERVRFVDSATAFTIYGTLPGAITAGNACRAMRIPENFADMQVLRTGVATYDGKKKPLAVGPGWVDIGVHGSVNSPVPFTVTATGTLSMPGFEVVMTGLTDNGNINDQLIGGQSNWNHTLIETGYSLCFDDVRNKNQIWIDHRFSDAMAANMVEKAGILRGRTADPTNMQLISGTARGWTILAQYDPSATKAPGGAGGAIITPYFLGGLVSNRAAKLNMVWVREDGLRFGIAGVSYSLGATGWNLHAGFQLQGPIDAVRGLRVTGSNISGAVSVAAYGETGGNVNFRFSTQNLGYIDFSMNGKRGLQLMPVANSVNYAKITQSIAGSPVVYGADGDDTNIDLIFTPKGTGRVRLAPFTAGSDAAITGYVEVKDTSGTLRKLAVIA